MTRLIPRLAIIPLLLLGVALLACDDEEDREDLGPGQPAGIREETRNLLTELRAELDRGIDPQRKENLVRRCADALERLRQSNDPQAERLAGFCDSLEDTNPNTPAAWDDIRARLDELIRQFSG